jgi:hypothetical protein
MHESNKYLDVAKSDINPWVAIKTTFLRRNISNDNNVFCATMYRDSKFDMRSVAPREKHDYEVCRRDQHGVSDSNVHPLLVVYRVLGKFGIPPFMDALMI